MTNTKIARLICEVINIQLCCSSLISPWWNQGNKSVDTLDSIAASNPLKFAIHILAIGRRLKWKQTIFMNVCPIDAIWLMMLINGIVNGIRLMFNGMGNYCTVPIAVVYVFYPLKIY